MKTEIIFLVNPNFYTEVKDRGVVTKFDIYIKNGIKFVRISSKEFDRYNHSNLIISSFYKWFIAKKYAKILNVYHIHYLQFDHLQLSLGLEINFFTNYRISGTLFWATLYYNYFFNDKDSFRYKLKNIRMYFLYKCLFTNRNIDHIFSLNPYFVSYGRKKFKKGYKLKHLPDPSLYLIKKKKYINNKENLNLPEDRIIFLLFGYLSERKGIFQTLNAIELLPEKYIARSCFIFSGKLDKNIAGKFLDKLERIRKIKDNLRIYVMNKFISDRMLFSLIDDSDCILIPYQKFTGSSAAIFWAAGAGKPVICQDYGLLGKWTDENNLGITVDSTNPKSLYEGIMKFIDNKDIIGNRKSMNDFAKTHTPEKFAEIIFSNILNK